MNGFKKVKPVIKKISFPIKGYMTFDLQDGRVINVPLSYFPSIRRLTPDQRKKWYVLDGEMFSFEDTDEVFHVEQILGVENRYKYTFIKKKAKA